MAQRKESKKTIKVRDMKPKKDAKGGGPGHSVSGAGHGVTGAGHGVTGAGHGVTGAGHGNT